MNVCIPVTENRGLESAVGEHFGSAPLFLIVDTESGACRAIENRDAHHAHGMCHPLECLREESLDAVVVGGIGAGALRKLEAAGLDVYLGGLPTAGEVVTALKAGTLRRASLETACAHHGQETHGGGCCH